MIAFNAAYRVKVLIAVVTIIMYTIAATFMAGGTFLTALWASRGDPTFAIDLMALLGISWLVWNLASFSWALRSVPRIERRPNASCCATG